MLGEEFIKLLDGVHQTSRGWSACCPAHDDSSPSLGISIADDDRILVHCFAGCSAQEICEALELQVRDLFPTQTRGPRVRLQQRRREHERIQKQHQQRIRGLQVEVTREADWLIQAAHSIDISTWDPKRLHQELERLARAYALVETELQHE